MESEERYFNPTSGWEDNLDSKNLYSKIIDIANSKTSLDSIFAKYKIKLEAKFSSTGWDFRCACPFPDHNERFPSFGYNPNSGIFNCFGCHRGGKAVEFIAYMENRSRIDVAREIVGNNISDEAVIHNSNFDFERLQILLFSFADNLRLFKGRHNNSSEVVQYAKAVSWNLDVYLQKHAKFNTIILNDLEARIIKLNEQLEAYGE